MATSGANSTPLGRLNPLLGSGKKPFGISLLNPSYMHGNSNGKEGGTKRDYDAAEREREREERRRQKKKSRWGGDEKEKTFIPGMPTVLPANLSKNQEEAYLVQLQIEEISRKLRTGDLGIPPNPEDRSPSPEPIYSSDGKRLNTREYRTRKRLEEDRHHLIQQMVNLNTDYKPPADYKPPVVRVSDKVMIPQEEHPDINFVGLLIGPRGNTLKAMERETGAKIIIRGKGSVKEGKVGRKDGQPLPGEDEPLHAYVTANNPESVKKAVEKIKEIIRQGVEVPEGQNDLRRMQLRELALLNGTLRENDGPRCTNCGASTHKSWQCPDKPNVTNNVVCSTCGGAGHIARDCRQKRPGSAGPVVGDRTKIDEEYMSLMAELGEGPPPPKDGDSQNKGFVRRTTNGTNLFERQLPPRALCAPPPRPDVPATTTQVLTVPSQPPIATPQQFVAPPWNPSLPPMQQNQQKPPTMMTLQANQLPNLSHPPPPGVPPPPPTQPPMMAPWQVPGGVPSGVPGTAPGNIPGTIQGTIPVTTQTQAGFPGIPPPNLLQAPPPPPPPSTQAPPNTQAAPISWMPQQQAQQPQTAVPPPQLPPWQQSLPPMGSVPPGPVPPPVRPPPPPPPPTMFPWQQNYVGVPPPQPVQPPPQQQHGQQQQAGAPQPGQNVDINALAGLPNLLAAPPPPPPS